MVNKSELVIAANVRARMAWKGLNVSETARLLGISQQGLSMKTTGHRPFSTAQLLQLAEILGLDDPGAFYRVPETFPEVPTLESVSACTSITYPVTSDFGVAA